MLKMRRLLVLVFAERREVVSPSQDSTDFLQFFLDDLCIFCKDFKNSSARS
jgi:hypothetical protein